ncbi:hypothetical protein RHSIM_Rhsim01G0150900 [Rhododendron simsii]|uniref:Uncharacterized protein n=1 Tax=Rhododendron simsii TaxID=118357 RepID=A0A834HK18_RHOSS|nr:hypothetical protein RHSIM_Rhsim01G0150900 [Rhododendron simsii]
MYLLDDTLMEHSSCDAVLSLFRRINPDMFIHSIVNAAYNSPFFISRFREALFHYFALFDMFEANVPRENEERMLFEREILGNEILGIIVCEGLERVRRLETYKQWQIRTQWARFRQLPLSQGIMKTEKAKEVSPTSTTRTASSPTSRRSVPTGRNPIQAAHLFALKTDVINLSSRQLMDTMSGGGGLMVKTPVAVWDSLEEFAESMQTWDCSDPSKKNVANPVSSSSVKFQLSEQSDLSHSVTQLARPLETLQLNRITRVGFVA